MRHDPAYQAYLSALETVAGLPGVQAAELDEAKRRCRAEVEALDRSRRDVARRWVGLRDNSSRLTRRLDELGRDVGAPPATEPVSDLLAPQTLPAALDTLRSDLDQTDQAWQWVLRHRERRVTSPTTMPPPAPAPAPTPAPATVAASVRKTVDPKLLLAVAGVVIAVLVLIVILTAI
ncbi:MAG: hypothetical protein JST91_29830 [Actinobacteria bacterium]|nr:hypothetical protein [Actinomycetota bacterium]